MVRKNTMNGRHAKRQNCSLQTTRGNCERGRDNDGIRSVIKQYYARIIVHRLAGDGATICFFVFSLWVVRVTIIHSLASVIRPNP